MTGTWNTSVGEALGTVAPPAGIDRRMLVIGCTSLSQGLGLSQTFYSGASAVAQVGYGDAVDALCHVIEQPQASGNSIKYPAMFYGMPSTTPGSYGAIDTSKVTGTAQVAVDNVVLPFGAYEGRLRVVKGGFIGTAGITLVDSLDNARSPESRETALGTATSYTIPNSGIKFNFTPSPADLTALNTLLNNIKTEFNAHVVDIAGSIHGAADGADVVGTANATNTATRIALANAIRAAYELHRVKTAGGVHGSADTTDVIAVPICTDDSTALQLALELKAKINAHEINITAAIHGAADNTNTITAAAPSAGSLLPGDIIYVPTQGPAFVAADIDTAAPIIANAPLDFRMVAFDVDMTTGLLSHVQSFLDACKATGKRLLAIVRFRKRNIETGETEAAWSILAAAEEKNFNDSRIGHCTRYGFVTDAMTKRIYFRPTMQQLLADLVRVPRSLCPSAPSDLPAGESMVKLIDSTGATLGHDEGPRGTAQGLSDEGQGNRNICEMRMPDQDVREAVFTTFPWVLYGPGEQIQSVPQRRLANAMEATAVSAARPILGRNVSYIAADPNTPGSQAQLTAKGRAKIHAIIFQAIADEFSGIVPGTDEPEIQNATDGALDTGVVQVSPYVTVGSGKTLNVPITLAPRFQGVVLSIPLTLAIQP